jgi:hypothetical protein
VISASDTLLTEISTQTVTFIHCISAGGAGGGAQHAMIQQ